MGIAVTLAPVVELKYVDGLQVYDCAPEAVRFICSPLQILFADEDTDTFGSEFTVTVRFIESIHPDELVPIILYVVVVEGFADTLAPKVVFSPFEGDQE